MNLCRVRLSITTATSLNEWTIVEEDSGRATHPDTHNYNLLTINGSVIEGELEFVVASAEIGQDNTYKIAQAFKQTL